MLRVLRVLATVVLVFISVLLFLMLGAWYFFAFDLQWGITWQALTIGLPLLAAVVFIPFCVVLLFKCKKLRWGLYIVGVGVVMLVCTGLFLWNYSYLLVDAPKTGPEETADTEENRILIELISEEGNGYNVVAPEVNFYFFKDYTEEKISNLKKYIAIENGAYDNDIGIVSPEFSSLFDRFIELNCNSPILTIKSSPEDGYYIDYDGKYSRYFENRGWGWLRWRLCRPRASNIDVSIPAYDKDTGLGIYYLGWQGDYLFGSGGIYTFEYQNGEIEFINYHEIWHS